MGPNMTPGLVSNGRKKDLQAHQRASITAVSLNLNKSLQISDFFFDNHDTLVQLRDRPHIISDNNARRTILPNWRQSILEIPK